MPHKLVASETISLYQAESQLSGLVDLAAEGEELVISNGGRPRARLAPLEDTGARRVRGLHRLFIAQAEADRLALVTR